ncbi:DUF2630 family protein [Streptacidiphilus jiangxiensis]|uniref:DUF2630 domain-containing protein n=1 Tax=Streptacidiphilus jiangxiensis TaxID=235985 RepID=A0A1H7HKA4_STRJI|nr:DUF2630 family protein [Streptacidiphilus jiangxiensis]SEK50077.1 Protein of unknown function [Streptacidiphilus jiangxiensis]
MTQQSPGGDDSILARIHELVGEERELRDQLSAQRIDADTERDRLAALETQLDQCWDLLRQRRARIDAGQDPDDARVRPASEVENYLS